jgi:heme oxygenase
MIPDRTATVMPAEPVALPSAVLSLRAATWPSHQRLEKRIDVKSRFTTLTGYRAHMENLWGFCASIESSLAVDAFGDALPDYPSRRKLSLLAQDLEVLGLSAAAISGLPRSPDLPDLSTTAAAFGCVYVLEGASLGGRTLLPVVESRLGLVPLRGAAFLASYGDAVSAMWVRFGAALDAWCHDGVRRKSAENAAVATFEALERWLCRVPA